MSIYLKIDGINGDVKTAGYENCIHIETIKLNTRKSNTINSANHSGISSGYPQFSEITMTKPLDKSSNLLFQKLIYGENIASIIISFTDSGGKSAEYYSISLTNCRLTSQEIDANNAGSENGSTANLPMKVPTETITIFFSTIELTYTPFDENKNSTSPIRAQYNRSTNES